MYKCNTRLFFLQYLFIIFEEYNILHNCASPIDRVYHKPLPPRWSDVLFTAGRHATNMVVLFRSYRPGIGLPKDTPVIFAILRRIPFRIGRTKREGGWNKRCR